MVRKVEVERADHERPALRQVVSSGARGRSIAGLVEEFESQNPEATAAGGISSAAIRAGDFVRTLRLNAGLSQAQLAAWLGVTQPRVCEIESGAGRQGPTWELMERVATVCGKAMPSADELRPLGIPAFSWDTLKGVYGDYIVPLADPAIAADYAQQACVAVNAYAGTTASYLRLNEINGLALLSVDVAGTLNPAAAAVKVIMRPVAVAGVTQETVGLSPVGVQSEK